MQTKRLSKDELYNQVNDELNLILGLTSDEDEPDQLDQQNQQNLKPSQHMNSL